mgnify:CR=1 FL=1|jgi:hypothetical protein
MKYYYFYSPIYEYYNNHIIENLKNIFDVNPILIDDIKPNLGGKKGHTFNGGVTIKIELVIKCIKENMNKMIIFTDCTIFINKNNSIYLKEYFNNYKKNDLTFADNRINDDHNIGIMLIDCNKKTLEFFEKVYTTLKRDKGWDQKVINDLLKLETDLIYEKFDNKIYCNWKLNNEYKKSFYIFKSFIRHKNDKIVNFNKRINIFYNSGLITKEEYNKIIK